MKNNSIIMINWKAIIIGFFVSIVLGTLLGFIIPLIGGILSTLLAGIIVGYISNGSLSNGAINGAVMGFLSRIIESIIILYIGWAFIDTLGYIIVSIGVLFILFLALFHIIIAAIGGAIGSAIK